MESLAVMVVLVGGGMFAYRQWKAIQAETQPHRINHFPVRPEVAYRDEPPAYTVCIEPEILPPLDAEQRRTSTPAKPKINKWVLFTLALLYVICPLDGDFIPVVGWIDDVAVMAFGIKALMTQHA